jgi:hypothetical protein
LLEKFQHCSEEKSADRTTLLGAPLISFAIKRTSTRVHPRKQNQKHCRMTQSGSTLEDNALVELALAGQTDCFSDLMNRHAAAVRKYLKPTDVK